MDSRFMDIYHLYTVEEILYVYQNIKENCEAYEIEVSEDSFFLNYMIPFTDIDATNPLCVVCEGSDIGKIYLVGWWFHHQNEFTIPFPQQLVADSLEDFINKMRIAEQDRWSIFYRKFTFPNDDTTFTRGPEPLPILPVYCFVNFGPCLPSSSGWSVNFTGCPVP